MAAKGERQINSFIRGLITESSPLTYPENASLDEQNFVLNRDGSRYRRLGMEYEEDYVLNNTGSATLDTVEYHEWKLSGGTSNISIGVVRVYDKLWFVNMLARSPSSVLLNGGASVTIAQLTTAPLSTAVINNALILVSSDLPYPIRLIYDQDNDSISQEQYKVYVRDFWGVYDGLIDNERPTVLSNCHNYNLLNQGWAPTVPTTCGTSAIACTYSTISKYPSNCDVWAVGKVADNTSADYEKYSPTELVKRMHDFLYAPRGKHIIDVFDRGVSRQTASGVTVAGTPVNGTTAPQVTWAGSLTSSTPINQSNPVSTTAVATSQNLPIDKETGSFTTVAAYAGRVWYSGVKSSVVDPDAKSPNLSGYVFFSQTVTNDEKIGKCYQEADPTSEEISDIIDTDGGTVHIVDAVNIVALVPTKGALLVFAENGIWQISGGQANFSATEYDLAKISAVGTIAVESIIVVNSEVFYWAKGGIFRIVYDNNDGGLKSENLSLTSIQTYYNDIPEVGRQHCRGLFDEKENKIRWIFNDSITYNGETKFNNELVLDLTLGAFYPNTIDDSTVYIADVIRTPDYAESAAVDEVVVGSDPVLISTLDEVVVNITESLQRTSVISYLAIDPTNLKWTFSKYRDTTFYDWTVATGGRNYSSYLVTGYDIFGEILRKKQVPYILFYFDRTEDGFTEVGGTLQIDNPSSCWVQAQWNWANSANSGKWGTPFQAYRLLRNYIPSGPSDTFDYGDRVIVTKNKLRGSGRALSLKIYSEAGKDMKILGWAMTVTGNSNP